MKKKFWAATLMGFLLLAGGCGASQELPPQGGGEEPVSPLAGFSVEGNVTCDDTRYEKAVFLSTPEDLIKLSQLVNSGDREYREVAWLLQNDIDMTGVDFKPIGNRGTAETYMDETNAFCGVFYGGGHTVSHLTVNLPEERYAGFFGLVGTAEISGLTVTGSICGRYSAGGIAGATETEGEALLSDCRFAGTVCALRQAGGVLGGSGRKNADKLLRGRGGYQRCL